MDGEQASVTSQKIQETHVLLVGNPGTGKSTMLNSMVGKAKAPFKAGPSYGDGLTHQLELCQDGPTTYMDTPGLADRKLRKQAAAAITEALKQNGFYKIFFVVCLQKGRIQAEDVTTMKLVLDAAPITNYGIIINQVPPKQYRDLKENPKREAPAPYDRVCASLVPAMSKGKTSLRVHLMARDKDLEDAKDAVKALPEDLRAFLQTTPGMLIAAQNVSDVNHEAFEELQERTQRELQDIRDQNKSLEDMIRQQDLEVQSLTQQHRQHELEAHHALSNAEAAGDVALKQKLAECSQKLEAEREALGKKLLAQGSSNQAQLDAEQAEAAAQQNSLLAQISKTLETAVHHRHGAQKDRCPPSGP